MQYSKLDEAEKDPNALTDLDITILRYLNEEDTPDTRAPRWGAAMSVSIEFLRGIGYAGGWGVVHITDKGRDFLKKLDNPE